MLVDCSSLSNHTEMRSCLTFSVSWLPAMLYQDVLHTTVQGVQGPRMKDAGDIYNVHAS